MRLTAKDLLRVLTVGFFACGYHAIYIDYLHPVFEYAHYRLEPKDGFQWLLIYILAILPTVWQRSQKNVVGAGVSLIYIFLYVPALITMCAMWIRPFAELAMLASSLMIGQLIIQSACFSTEYKIKNAALGLTEYIGPCIATALGALTVFSVTIFIFQNFNHMRLVGFADVYELRFASSAATGLLSGYLSMWLLGVSIPYYLSLATYRMNYGLGLLVLIICIIVYMGNGAKSALLMPIQGILLGVLISEKRNTTQFLAFWCAIVLWVLYFYKADWLDLFKSFFLMRLLSTGGWTLTTYYEYFVDNGWTYYTHIGPVGTLFGRVYLEELGRIIGLEYWNSSDANFNANFWATDGVAAWGIVGIISISLIMYIILKFLNIITIRVDPRSASILLVGFWLGILNASLFTSLFSGGGLILLFILSWGYYRSTKFAESSRLHYLKRSNNINIS